MRVDDAAAAPVVIVNEAFVRRYLAEGNVLGRRLTFRRPFEGDLVAHAVIGVVADMKEGLGTEPAPELYAPLAQNGWPNIKIVYRPRATANSPGRSLAPTAAGRT